MSHDMYWEEKCKLHGVKIDNNKEESNMAIKVEKTAFISGEELNLLIAKAIEKETNLKVKKIVFEKVEGSIQCGLESNKEREGIKFSDETYGITVEF